MDSDLVARGDDLRSQRGMARDLLADQIEGRANPGSRELVEDGHGAFGMWPVVKGEGDPVLRFKA